MRERSKKRENARLVFEAVRLKRLLVDQTRRALEAKGAREGIASGAIRTGKATGVHISDDSSFALFTAIELLLYRHSRCIIHIHLARLALFVLPSQVGQRGQIITHSVLLSPKRFFDALAHVQQSVSHALGSNDLRMVCLEQEEEDAGRESDVPSLKVKEGNVKSADNSTRSVLWGELTCLAQWSKCSTRSATLEKGRTSRASWSPALGTLLTTSSTYRSELYFGPWMARIGFLGGGCILESAPAAALAFSYSLKSSLSAADSSKASMIFSPAVNVSAVCLRTSVASGPAASASSASPPFLTTSSNGSFVGRFESYSASSSRSRSSSRNS